MKIVMFATNLPGISADGGIGSYVVALAKEFAARGNDVHVIGQAQKDCIKVDGYTLWLDPMAYIPVFERLLPSLGSMLALNRIVKQINDQSKIDIIEYPNFEGTGLLSTITNPRTPTVVRMSTSSQETGVIDGSSNDRQNRWAVWREKSLCRMADSLITHSRAHELHMRSEVDLLNREVNIVPIGIDVAQNSDIRRNNECKTVVYLGRLEKRKGTIDLLHAIPAVLEKHPNTNFIFIGSDRKHAPNERNFHTYFREEFSEIAEDKVRFLGRLPQEEVDQWLKKADIFVAPSLYESFGMIYIEAMQWGAPVIGTTAGGIPEIVTHEETGILVGPSNASELGLAICRLLESDELRMRLAHAGYLLVKNEYSISRMADRTLEVYKKAINNFAPRSIFSRVASL
jgi:glycosyltransferase involved in cell wall biosynthesis